MKLTGVTELLHIVPLWPLCQILWFAMHVLPPTAMSDPVDPIGVGEASDDRCAYVKPSTD